jgi:hypothetical protein
MRSCVATPHRYHDIDLRIASHIECELLASLMHALTVCMDAWGNSLPGYAMKLSCLYQYEMKVEMLSCSFSCRFGSHCCHT